MTINAANLMTRLGCCKFCGGQPAIKLRRGLRVYCPDCGRHKQEHYYDVDEAVEAWNADGDDDIPFYGDMDEGEDEEVEDRYIAQFDGKITGKLLPAKPCGYGDDIRPFDEIEYGYSDQRYE